MEYIKNSLKELIGIMFLCTILYVLTPRFIKVIVKAIAKTLFRVTCLAIKLVKGIIHVATPILKGNWNTVLSEYGINTANNKKERVNTKSKTLPNNVIPFDKKVANTK